MVVGLCPAKIKGAYKLCLLFVLQSSFSNAMCVFAFAGVLRLQTRPGKETVGEEHQLRRKRHPATIIKLLLFTLDIGAITTKPIHF